MFHKIGMRLGLSFGGMIVLATVISIVDYLEIQDLASGIITTIASGTSKAA